MIDRVIDGCIKCGACLRECPVLRQEGEGRFPGPRRLAVEAPRFNAGLAALRDPLSLCTTCSRCGSVCPSNLPLPEALVRVRALLWEGGRSEGQQKMLHNVDRTLRTVLPEREGPPAPDRGDLAFFPGCIAHGRLPEETAASLALLRAAGGRPFVPKDWACCGSPLEKIGERDRLEKVRQRNTDLLSGVEEVVTSCPGCTVQLRNMYHKDAWHILEYLHRTGLPARSFEPRGPPVKVTLHRPCHLARVVGPHTMDMARELLEALPGVIVVEHEGADECCGGGGGVASAHPEASKRMAERKLRLARGSGADLLLAPCPFCVLNLRRAGGMEVQDLMVFLAGRLSRSNKQ